MSQTSCLIGFPLFTPAFFYVPLNGSFSLCFPQASDDSSSTGVYLFAAQSACSFPVTPLCTGIHSILIWHPRFLRLVDCASIPSLMSGLFPLVKFSSASTDANESVKILPLIGGFSAAVSSAQRIPTNSTLHTDVLSVILNPLLIFQSGIMIPAPTCPWLFFDPFVYIIRLSRLSSSVYSYTIPLASKSSVFLVILLARLVSVN